VPARGCWTPVTSPSAPTDGWHCRIGCSSERERRRPASVRFAGAQRLAPLRLGRCSGRRNRIERASPPSPPRAHAGVAPEPAPSPRSRRFRGVD
jgi:hypothetical protein